MSAACFVNSNLKEILNLDYSDLKGVTVATMVSKVIVVIIESEVAVVSQLLPRFPL
jgi:hypothetical protein